MPTLFGVQVPWGTIAIVISLAGSHVIYVLVTYFWKKEQVLI